MGPADDDRNARRGAEGAQGPHHRLRRCRPVQPRLWRAPHAPRTRPPRRRAYVRGIPGQPFLDRLPHGYQSALPSEKSGSVKAAGEMNQGRSYSHVTLVVDPAYGTRAKEKAAAGPLWVIQSPANTPAIQELWATGDCPFTNAP